MQLSKIINQLNEVESVLGFNPNSIPQGSEEWRKMKLGVISASKAKELMMKSSSKTRETYLATLVSQVATGFMEEISARPLEWGHLHEDSARAAYEFSKNVKVKEVPFIYGDSNLRYGISPDGLVMADDGDTIVMGAEIKCPWNPVNFIKFCCNHDIKKEHELQCQFSMFVTGSQQWDYVNYDPRMSGKQIHSYTYERNESLMSSFRDSIDDAVHTMDKMLSQIGLKFGDQWERG